MSKRAGAFQTTFAILGVLLAVSLACSMPAIRLPNATPIADGSPQPTLPPALSALPTPTQHLLPPALVESSPSQASEIALDGTITLYFNQPMDRASVEAALVRQPDLDARLTWTDEATLVFTPVGLLAADTTLSLSLSEAARSSSGMNLSAPISLTYQTAGPLKLTERLPRPDSASVDPTSAIVAAFNRPVVPLGAGPDGLPPAFSLEPAAQGRSEWLNASTYIFYPEPALEGGLRYTVQINPDLRSASGSPLESTKSWSFTTESPRLLSIEPASNIQPIALDEKFRLTFNQPMDPASLAANLQVTGPDGAPLPGDLSWDENFSQVTFTPIDLLQRNITYTITLAAQAQTGGGTPLGASISAGLHTSPELAFVSSDPPPGGILGSSGELALRFSSPIDLSDLSEKMTLTPAVFNLYDWWDASDRSLHLKGDFAPSTAYTITLSPDLQDIWGGRLGQELTSSFSTLPLDSGFIIPSSSDVLFLTPQEPGLTVQATNVFTAQYSVGQVALPDFIKLLSNQGSEFQKSYQPANLQARELPLALLPNRTQPVILPLTTSDAPLSPGIYTVELAQAQGSDRLTLLVISNLQLTLKASAGSALVWAVDLRTQAPVMGALINLFDGSGALLGSGQTGQDGVLKLTFSPLQDPYSLLHAVSGEPGQENFAITYSNWNLGISSWDYALPGDFSPARLQAYFYSDRPVYRPGQTIYFRSILRQAYNGRYQLPELERVTARLIDANQQEVARLDMPLSAFGSGHGQIELPDGLATGFYELGIPDVQGSLQVQVANYRKPEIALQAAFDLAQAGQLLKAHVKARYYYDAPAGDLPVHWALYSRTASFELPGYQVGVSNQSWLESFQPALSTGGLGWLVSKGDGQIDPDGSFNLELGPEQYEPQGSGQDSTPESDPVIYQRRILTLEVTTQDESGLPVSSRTEVQLDPSPFFVGVRSDRWIGQAGEPTGFEVQIVDANGDPAGIHSLRAEFQEVTWVRADPPGQIQASGLPEFSPQYTPIASTDFTTSDTGQARLEFIPPKAGIYQLRISSLEAGSERVRTELTLWAGGPGQAAWPNLTNSHLVLSADRTGQGASYRAGETAEIFIPNPFAGQALTLVTVERGLVLRHQLLTLDGNGANLSLPLLAEDAPNVFVSVLVLGKDERGQSDFRLGYLSLQVEPEQQTLQVSLTGHPERSGPGQEVSFEIQVSDSTGSPVEGEFSLAVVDRATLALTEPNSAGILSAFYGPQPLGVQTSLPLAVHLQRQVFSADGMGGGGSLPEVVTIRDDFPDTAYWNAEIVTGPDGKARVTLPLPDTLTTWWVEVRGLTGDTRVGQTQAQIITNRDLIIRPVTPRFLVIGDHALLGAIIQNNTEADLQVSAALQASGFTLDDSSQATQEVTVSANGRLRVDWWGVAQDAESADLVFSAQAGSRQDAARPALGPLPILRYTAPLTFSASGVLGEAGERLEVVSLPRTFTPTSGNLRLELSPSLAAAMMGSLAALERDPFAGTEQIVSRFLPSLEAYRALQQFGAETSALKERRDRTVADGLQQLAARQNQEGAWGWWQDQESNPLITAYVLFGLLRAQQAGVQVDPAMVQGAIQYLQPQMEVAGLLPQAEIWQLNRLAFGQFVLAEAGVSDLANLEALYDLRAQLDPWAQALLALAFEKISPGGDEARTLVSDLQAGAVRSATGAHWETNDPGWQNMLNPQTSQAIVIYALAQRDPASTLLPEAVRYLMVQRQGSDAWNSTYTTAWSVLALTEVIKGTAELGGDFIFQANLNGAPFASGQASGVKQLNPVSAVAPLTSLYVDSPNELVLQRQAGPGRLYYTLALQLAQPAAQAIPLSQGLSLARAYYPAGQDCATAACEPLLSGLAGELLTVRLALMVAQDAFNLLVEDDIPAGAEILDLSLKTSQQGQDAGPVYDPQQPFAQGWGWWAFNPAQIYDNRIVWTADYLPAGTYELSYSLILQHPGEYHLLPARAWQLYFPEVQATSAGGLFAIQPGP